MKYISTWFQSYISQITTFYAIYGSRAFDEVSILALSNNTSISFDIGSPSMEDLKAEDIEFRMKA